MQAHASEVFTMLSKIRLTLITAAKDVYSIRCDAINADRRRHIQGIDELDPALFEASVAGIKAHADRNRRWVGFRQKRRGVHGQAGVQWQRTDGGRLRQIPRLSYGETYCGLDLPSAYLLTRPMLKKLHSNRLAPIPWF